MEFVRTDFKYANGDLASIRYDPISNMGDGCVKVDLHGIAIEGNIHFHHPVMALDFTKLMECAVNQHMHIHKCRVNGDPIEALNVDREKYLVSKHQVETLRDDAQLD